VAHLISHSSGIRHYNKGEWMKVSRSGCSTAKEAIGVFVNDPLEFEPGTKYSYSSFGYVLLSAMVEAITQMPFQDYIRTEILMPAAVNGIALDKSPEATTNESSYYEKWDLNKGKAKRVEDVNNSCKFGGGGFVGTSAALVNLHMAMLDGNIVSGDALEKYYTTFTNNAGESLKYGFGIGVLEGDGVKYHTHTGSAVGANGAMIIYPKERVVVVILGNLEDSAMNAIIGKVGRVFR
jgi:serine beta-lactamase-like protein LACTB, mitochondrial